MYVSGLSIINHRCSYQSISIILLKYKIYFKVEEKFTSRDKVEEILQRITTTKKDNETIGKKHIF